MRIAKPLAVAAILAAVAVSAGSGPPAEATVKPLRVVGLTDDGRLTVFPVSNPRHVYDLGKVRGLKGGEHLIGIDYRVQDGRLYGVGTSGGIYRIGLTGHPRADQVSQLTVPLTGNSFGVDFNPAANRLRVISDTGQNLRHNLDDPMGAPAAGTTATDTPLTFPGPPPVAAAGVAAAAYTNNDLSGDTATSLFDLDTTADQVVVQSPANAGLLAPTGKLGVDTGAGAGFDIYSQLSRGATVRNTGFATLSVSGRQAFYRIDLLTGDAQSAGAFPGKHQVVDISLPLAQR